MEFPNYKFLFVVFSGCSKNSRNPLKTGTTRKLLKKWMIHFT